LKERSKEGRKDGKKEGKERQMVRNDKRKTENGSTPPAISNHLSFLPLFLSKDSEAGEVAEQINQEYSEGF
jgi:hypothetical protein